MTGVGVPDKAAEHSEESSFVGDPNSNAGTLLASLDVGLCGPFAPKMNGMPSLDAGVPKENAGVPSGAPKTKAGEPPLEAAGESLGPPLVVGETK